MCIPIQILLQRTEQVEDVAENPDGLGTRRGALGCTACTRERVVTNRGYSPYTITCRLGDVGLPSTSLASSL